MNEPRITINNSGLLRVDGIALFRIIARPGAGTTIQLCDSNRERSAARGTRFVEIAPEKLISVIESQKKLDK